MTGVTNEAGTAYASGSPDFITIFSEAGTSGSLDFIAIFSGVHVGQFLVF